MKAINALRHEKGLTIKEFAEALGISVSYFKAMAYGDKGMTMGVIRRIHKAFPDVEIGALINDNL